MKSTRVALDANEANVKHRVGSNIYAFKLLLELEKCTRAASDISFVVYVSSALQKDFPQERQGWTYKIVTPSTLWTQWRFPMELFLHARSYDLVLSLGHYAPRFCPIKSVVCVLDLAFLQFPQFFRKKDVMQLRAWTAYSVRNAKHIITISQNSKLDVMKEYGRGPEEISIVYPGVELPKRIANHTEVKTLLEKFGLTPKSYFVSVGTIQPRKNMIHLIHAFEQLEGTPKLVFVGKSGWLTSEFEETLAVSSAKDRIIVTGFVDDETKYALLSQARASVLVGFYEGFGIPVIESMGVGVIPVVAQTGSLPEVVGDLGVMVDPYSVDDIARGLREAWEAQVTQDVDRELRTRAAEFSWEKSGRELLTVLRKV